MADVPAWYWQVLGAVGGLGLGLLIGVMSFRKPKNPPPTPAVRPSRPTPLGATGPATVIAPAAAGEARSEAASQRLLERLRETNLDLTAKLRAATDSHARELLERSQQQQVEQQRHERQLEELRAAHANELSQLMSAMVEQVDGMQREHAEKLASLQEEIDQLKRLSQTVVDPVTLHMGGDMRPPPGGLPPLPRQP